MGLGVRIDHQMWNQFLLRPEKKGLLRSLVVDCVSLTIETHSESFPLCQMAITSLNRLRAPQRFRLGFPNPGRVLSARCGTYIHSPLFLFGARDSWLWLFWNALCVSDIESYAFFPPFKWNGLIVVLLASGFQAPVFNLRCRFNSNRVDRIKAQSPRLNKHDQLS